ncbi:MAG: hypothetical protein ACREDZ_08190 [Kiloniellales bacterium]
MGIASMPRMALLAFAALLMLSPARPGFANVTAVVPTPPVLNVALNQGGAVTVTWRIEQNDSQPRTIESTVGTFFVNGNPIATVNRALRRAVSIGNNVVFITETVLVPRSVVYQASKLGIQSLQYQRIFDDTLLPATGVLALAVTGSGSAGFAISRVDLSFLEEPGANVVVAERGATLHPVARVRFAGSGFLSAEWKVADAASSPGQQIFVSRRIVRRYLTAGGEVEIVGPALPTNTTGQYHVIFELNDVERNPVDRARDPFQAARVSYYVRTPSPEEAQVPLARILLSSPDAQSKISDEARVAWNAVADAAVYQIVFYAADATPLIEPEERATYGQESSPPQRLPGDVVAGFYVRAEEGTEATVPATSLSHLETGQPYFLQVIARNSGGAPVGQSEPREIWR